MRQPKFRTGKNQSSKVDSVTLFANRMYPLYYDAYVARGLSHEDAVKAATLTSTQAAWESDYGRSNIAKKLHNYGGMGYNGKTYTTYKDDSDFVNSHVDLAMKNGMYKAKNLSDYAKIAKQHGYYSDSLLHYSNSLNTMYSYANAVKKAANNHILNKLQMLQPAIIAESDNTYTQRPVIIPDPYGDVRLQSTINGKIAGQQAMLNIQLSNPWNPGFQLRLPSIQSQLEQFIQPTWRVQ